MLKLKFALSSGESTLRERVVRGSAWVGLSVALAVLAQFVQLALLARLLSPYALGVVAAILMAMALADLIAALGLSAAIVQRENTTSDELSSLYWFNVFVGVCVAALMACLGMPLAWFFRMPELAYLIPLLAVSLLVTSHGVVARGLLTREMRFRGLALADLSHAFLVLVVGVGLVALGLGPLGVVLGFIVASGVRTVALVWLARSDFRPTLHFRFQETRRFLQFGVLQSLDSIVGFISANVGAIVTGRVVSPSAMGGFTLANTYAVNTPARLNSVVTQVAFPALSRMQHDVVQRSRASLLAIEAAGLINAPLLMGLIVTAPSFVAVVLGAQWMHLTPLVQVLAVVGLTRALGNPMGAVIMAADRMGLGLIINVVKSAITIAATIIGARLADVMGIAWALVVVGALGVVLNIVLLRVLLQCPVTGSLRAHFTGVVLAIPMAVIVIVAQAAFAGAAMPAVWSFTLSVVIGALVFFGTIFIVPNELRHTLLAMVGGRKR